MGEKIGWECFCYTRDSLSSLLRVPWGQLDKTLVKGGSHLIGNPGNLVMYNEDGVGPGKCEGGHFNYNKIEVGGHPV